MKKKKITELSIYDFLAVLPAKLLEARLEFLCGKREVKHFWNFMVGQTVMSIEKQGGIYAGDFERFLKYRKKGLAGSKMPLDD